MLCDGRPIWVSNKNQGFVLQVYRLASPVVPYYECQRLVELNDVLIVRAERPDPLDQHLQQGAADMSCFTEGNQRAHHPYSFRTLSIVHILQ